MEYEVDQARVERMRETLNKVFPVLVEAIREALGDVGVVLVVGDYERTEASYASTICREMLPSVLRELAFVVQAKLDAPSGVPVESLREQ